MTDVKANASRRRQRLAGAAGLLLVGGIGGGVIAATASASAQTAPSPSTSSAAGTRAAAERPGLPADGPASVRDGEKALTGTNLATAKAAALKAVPGGTVFRVETDADGATYEAHMTKADGSRVTVKFDKSFKVTAIQEGMGAGGRHGPGGAGGPAAPTSGGSA